VSRSTCALSIVVPTRNEAPNVAPLVDGLEGALADLTGGWELIFVDDSDDATPAEVRSVAERTSVDVRLLHREPGARQGGLGGAVQAGFRLARGRVISVMDGDLQHPPEVIPALVAPPLSGDADIVAGSRYGQQKGTDGLDGPWRRLVSWSCRWLAYLAVPASRPFEDPLSGLFAVRREVVEEADLRADGYKILLEVAARGQWRSACNVAYSFAERNAGDSKASLREGLVFLRHLVKLTYRSRHTTRAPGSGAQPAPAASEPRPLPVRS